MKIIKSELEGKIDNILTALEQDSNDAENLIKALNSVPSKEELNGEAYDQIRTKIEGYISVLKKRQEVSTLLHQDIMSAKGKMLNYMEDENELDDSQLENIKAQLNEAKTNYNNAYAAYQEACAIAAEQYFPSSTTITTSSSSNSTSSSIGQHVYDSVKPLTYNIASKTNYELKISYPEAKYLKYKTQFDELTKLVEKLENLQSTDNTAYATLDTAITQISNYKSSVSNIQEANISGLTTTPTQEI